MPQPEKFPEELEDEFRRLLEELRVALPGIQIIFAFLLTVPFSARFEGVTPFQEKVYFTTLMCTVVASILMIAPTSYHRLRFRRHDDPEQMVRMSNRFSIGGLAFLALAITSAVLLISDFVFGRTTAITTTSVTFALAFGAWYVIPLRRYLAAK